MSDNDRATESTSGNDPAVPRSNNVEVIRGDKETPVIDVHVPHATHTWKDFWIHLGTIAAGLLIAISLEQSVEALHRLHERHVLEADLQVEARRNHDYALIDIAIYDKVIAWLLELQRGVDAVRDSHGKAGFVYPARPDGIPDSDRYVAYHVLQTEVWTTAKESSQLVLLPREEAEVYARAYIQADQVQWTRDRVRDLGIRQGAFEGRYSRGRYPAVPDVARFTPQQLDEYETVLADELEEVRIAQVRLRIFAAANDYLLSGGRDQEEMRKALVKANTPQ
jgi:hypothetical protein